MTSFSPQPSHDHQYCCNNLRRSTSNIRYTREQQQPSQQRQRCVFQKQQESQEKLLDRAASAHEYAQKLNNVSTMYIEIAKYDKAIESLGKALRLSEFHTTDQLLDRTESCKCRDCSLDGCIRYSENDSNLIELFDISSKTSTKNKRNKESKKNSSKRSATEMEGEETIPNATLYRKPIRIPKRSIREGHNMGSTLFLIITFNLALAHHLKAIKLNEKIDDVSSLASRNLLNSTFKLYELANNWQYPSSSQGRNDNYVTDSEDEDDSSEFDSIHGSIRFQKILYNNLNHLNQMMMINKSNENDTGSRMLKRRLNSLISTVTPVVTTDDESNKSSNSYRTTELQTQPPTTTTATNNNYSCAVSSCDLEFEYYKQSDQDEFYADQEELRRHQFCSLSSTTTKEFKQNAYLDTIAEPVPLGEEDISACTAMRTSVSFLCLQTAVNKYAHVA